MQNVIELLEKFEKVYEGLTIQQKLDFALDEGVICDSTFSERMIGVMKELHEEGLIDEEGNSR